jgi:hypothetical protein
MTEREYPGWQTAYEELVLEADQQKFTDRFPAAREAIVSRMKNMRITSDTRMEAIALERALRALAALKHERLNASESSSQAD